MAQIVSAVTSTIIFVRTMDITDPCPEEARRRAVGGTVIRSTFMATRCMMDMGMQSTSTDLDGDRQDL